jgi:hypothetical protein
LRFGRDAVASLAPVPAALDRHLGSFGSLLRLVLDRPHLGTGRARIFLSLDSRVAVHPEGPALLPFPPLPSGRYTIGSMYAYLN